MNYSYEARKIIHEHTVAMISSSEYNPESNEKLLEFMTDECAFILSEHFMDGEYNPMEYNAIRNELARLLWSLFEKHL